MDRIIFATGNQDKMREIREILSEPGMEILSMKEAGIELDIVEDGTSFEENAMIKASALAKSIQEKHTAVMADDSGLEIDYLNKEPEAYKASGRGAQRAADGKVCLRHCSSFSGWNFLCDQGNHRGLYRMGACGRKRLRL